MARSGPIVAHDLRQINTTGQTAGKLCDALFGFCSTPPVNPFTVPLPRAAPAHPKPIVAPKPRRKPITVVHLSDVHIDRQYTVGSEANCTKSICCRNFADEAGQPITVPAGPNGNSRCDSTTELANSMLEAIDALNPKFSIFTGDVVEGRSLQTSWISTPSWRQVDGAYLPCIGGSTLPNHFCHISNDASDSAPVNAFARSTTVTANNSQFVLTPRAKGGSASSGKQLPARWTIILEAIRPRPRDQAKVRVPYQYLGWAERKQDYIINTNIGTSKTCGYTTQMRNNPTQRSLAFIVQQLQIAEDAGEKAWIIGHIPLGKEDTFDDQDQFEIAYSDYSNQIAANAVSIAQIAPALTPTSEIIIRFRGWTLTDAVTQAAIPPSRFMTLIRTLLKSWMRRSSSQTSQIPRSNTSVSAPSRRLLAYSPHSRIAKWGLYYSARETWGPLVGLKADSALTPAFWHNLTDVFVANDTAFQLFNTHISRGGAVTACDADCKNSTICDMRAFRSQNNCDTPAMGLSLKRDNGGRVIARESSECEGFGFGQLLSKMAAAGN
ncbi:hypothetical protein BD779DRAFT_1470172 [Infundibulicybe gibba]|nr:hypothetical protein BD779DRAFT_1470172 [Infundibulicybe gibba]